MKRETLLKVPDAAEGCPFDVSAEGVLRHEVAKLAEWLEDQGIDVRTKDGRAHGGRDQLYWRYGYFMGLKQALAMLTSCDETVH